MEERSEELVERIHAVGADLLEKFASACDALGLRYSLSSGTLLGAVRHGGFIPWDDDIDVAMPRADYEIFLEKGQAYLPEGYFLQHYTNQKYTQDHYIKIRNSNTAWILKSDVRGKGQNLGFSMDVFPIDRLADETARKKAQKKAKLYMLLTRDYVPHMTYGSAVKNLRSLLTLPVSRILGRRKLHAKHDALEKAYSCGEFTAADDLNKERLMPYSIFEEYDTILFEGKPYRCVKEKEAYLTAMYGANYMQLPPPEARVMHLADIIDTEESYLKYEKK